MAAPREAPWDRPARGIAERGGKIKGLCPKNRHGGGWFPPRCRTHALACRRGIPVRRRSTAPVSMQERDLRPAGRFYLHALRYDGGVAEHSGNADLVRCEDFG